MPKFETIKWDVFEAIWQVISPLAPEQQVAVIAHLKAKGVEMTWDALRQDWDAPGLYRELLLALVKRTNPSNEDWIAAVNELNQAGWLFTWSGFSTIWDDRARSVLLQAVMEVAPPTIVQWESILEKVHEIGGYSYTHKAAFRILHKWDDKSDRDLLIAVLGELSTPTPEQMKRIVQRCHETGYTFTVGAATQHLQKLKKKDPAGPSASSTPSTPKGRKTGTALPGSGAKSASKRGRKTNKGDVELDDDYAQTFDISPSKKAKTEQEDDIKSVEAKIDRVKTEHEEEDGAI